VRRVAAADLGRIQLESGRLDEAIAGLSQAHRLHRAAGDLTGQAQALRYLGQAQSSAGHAGQARESLEAALALFKDLNAEAEAQEVHSTLVAVGQPVDPARR
jgi:tetratricopeptide (TPR) repeat protein